MASNNHLHSSDDVVSRFDLILERMDYQAHEIKEIKEHVTKISDIVVDPEKGLYGRVKMLEARKENHSRLFWIIITSFVGLVGSSFFWVNLFK